MLPFQSSQETTAVTTTTTNTVNFTQTNSTSTVPVTQAIGSDIQDLIMHHQSHATTTAGETLYVIFLYRENQPTKSITYLSDLLLQR